MDERLLKSYDLSDLKENGTQIQKALVNFIETGDPTHLKQYVTDREALFNSEKYDSINDTFDKPQPIEQLLRSAIYFSNDPETAEYEVAQTMRLLWSEYASVYELQTIGVEDIREANQNLAGVRYWIIEELLEHDVLLGKPAVQT